MRIGIIGGGIAGLTTGALASKIGHDVTVYESSREWGGCAGKLNVVTIGSRPELRLAWDLRQGDCTSGY